MAIKGQFAYAAAGATMTSAAERMPNNANRMSRLFRVLLQGLTGSGATVTLQISLDNGATWTAADTAYTADTNKVYSEPSNEALYRLLCTGQTSGTINYYVI